MFPGQLPVQPVLTEHFYWAALMQGSLVRRKLSIRLSNMCTVTKRKKDLSRFFYTTWKTT